MPPSLQIVQCEKWLPAYGVGGGTGEEWFGCVGWKEVLYSWLGRGGRVAAGFALPGYRLVGFGSSLLGRLV